MMSENESWEQSNIVTMSIIIHYSAGKDIYPEQNFIQSKYESEKDTCLNKMQDCNLLTDKYTIVNW